MAKYEQARSVRTSKEAYRIQLRRVCDAFEGLVRDQLRSARLTGHQDHSLRREISWILANMVIIQVSDALQGLACLLQRLC